METLNVQGVSIREIIKAVEKINEEIFESTGFEEGVAYRPVSILIDGADFCATACIECFGIQIWCSDEDEREFDEDKNDYESLELYLRKEIKSLVSTISQIKI